MIDDRCRRRIEAAKRRCRMHGGAKGSGGQKGNRNALKHGLRTASHIKRMRHYREMLAEAKALVV